MSKSKVWTVAAGDRLRWRVGAASILRLFPALVLLLHAPVLAAAEAPSPSLERNSFYLSSAGFRVQIANTPTGQKALHAMPAHRFVTEGTGDTLRYLYAEPEHCVCIFVGTQQAYDSYRKILSQPVKPTSNASPDYKTQAGVLLSGQPLRQSTRGDPTTLSDYLGTLTPHY
jgi:hypothetical protein